MISVDQFTHTDWPSRLHPPLPAARRARSTKHFASWIHRQGFFDGQVGISRVPEEHRDAEQAPGDLSNLGLDEASALLKRAHPIFYNEFSRYVSVVHPVTHKRIPVGSLCSNSANSTLDPPGVLLTVTRPSATAEALVHEMAHHKLFAAGITTEESSGYLHDDSKLAYSAAVERERPIPAILHAAYSFLHMVEFDLRLIHASLCGDEPHQLLRGNLRVSRDTVGQLEQHAKPTAKGSSFMGELTRWADHLFEQADIL